MDNDDLWEIFRRIENKLDRILSLLDLSKEDRIIRQETSDIQDALSHLPPEQNQPKKEN